MHMTIIHENIRKSYYQVHNHAQQRISQAKLISHRDC